MLVACSGPSSRERAGAYTEVILTKDQSEALLWKGAIEYATLLGRQSGREDVHDELSKNPSGITAGMERRSFQNADDIRRKRSREVLAKEAQRKLGMSESPGGHHESRVEAVHEDGRTSKHKLSDEQSSDAAKQQKKKKKMSKKKDRLSRRREKEAKKKRPKRLKRLQGRQHICRANTMQRK